MKFIDYFLLREAVSGRAAENPMKPGTMTPASSMSPGTKMPPRAPSPTPTSTMSLGLKFPHPVPKSNMSPNVAVVNNPAPSSMSINIKRR